ncbi:ASCH domain-containing protein [Sphaerisporangium siamense]|uniref:ASC-1-like (ASCH) protein n=1 Tax=Sphaerisporangium siamense TaxID=795645 RepID=A0A7W7D9Q7_9ACTN|nr:ASCH domain-containing protein [Sphaerisporangium siamense]MBB4702601.1 ASC-1-like (ASCH) protein [Sphaerisporangium siamense]
MNDPAPKSELNIRKPYFQLIVNGAKTVEVRVGYPRMRKIRPGHMLTFVSGDDRVTTRVTRVTEYASFEEMLDREDPRLIGGDLGENPENLLAVIRSIYPPEKERLGVLAIEIDIAT